MAEPEPDQRSELVGAILLLLTVTLYPGGIGQQLLPIRRWMAGGSFRAPRRASFDDDDEVSPLEVAAAVEARAEAPGAPEPSPSVDPAMPAAEEPGAEPSKPAPAPAAATEAEVEQAPETGPEAAPMPEAATESAETDAPEPEPTEGTAELEVAVPDEEGPEEPAPEEPKPRRASLFGFRRGKDRERTS